MIGRSEDTMFGLTDAELDVRFAEAVLGSSGGNVSETGLAWRRPLWYKYARRFRKGLLPSRRE